MHGETFYQQLTTRAYCQNADSTLSFDCHNFDVIKSLNVVSYNVDGLFSKLSDIDFLSFIDQFDCVCLLETYMTDNIIPKHVFTQFLPRPFAVLRLLSVLKALMYV